MHRDDFLREDQVNAKQYVGTTELSGQLQFELLEKEGLTPSAKVLDVGSGALHAGFILAKYLEPGNYVSIEPNQWLTEEALKESEVKEEMEKKKALFLKVTDFDGSSLGLFDFVLAHSVLSHAAYYQLEQFLRNTSKALTPKGKILASLRLAEGNEWGSQGSSDKKDTRNQEWQYPNNSFFALMTVMEAARICGLQAEHKPEFTKFYTTRRPTEFHDWFVFTRSTQ